MSGLLRTQENTQLCAKPGHSLILYFSRLSSSSSSYCFTIIIFLVGFFVKLQVLGLRPGVDFTFTLDNNDDNDNNNNPHLNFFKGTVLGVKEQGLGIRDMGQVSRVKG